MKRGSTRTSDTSLTTSTDEKLPELGPAHRLRGHKSLGLTRWTNTQQGQVFAASQAWKRRRVLRALLKCCNRRWCESCRGHNCPCAARHSARENAAQPSEAHQSSRSNRSSVPNETSNLRGQACSHPCGAMDTGATPRTLEAKKKHHLSEDLPFQPLLQARCSAFGSSGPALPFSPFVTSWRLVSHLPVACSLIIHGCADTVCAMFSVESV